jgi:hypothetical protein
LNFGVETGEVEAVEDVLFVDFAKVFVPFRSEEPAVGRVERFSLQCFGGRGREGRERTRSTSWRKKRRKRGKGRPL